MKRIVNEYVRAGKDKKRENNEKKEEIGDSE